MTTNREDAIAAVLAAIGTVTVPSGAEVTVTDYEPLPGDIDLGHIYITWAGETATDFQITVGIIARSEDGTAQAAQALRLELIDFIDRALDAKSLGPPGAAGTYLPQWNAWGATFTIDYPRDDF